MAFHVFFSFSLGLAKTIYAPKGTKAAIDEHVKWVESTLKLEREQFLDNPVHWKFCDRFVGVPDDALCAAAKEHNDWVRSMYEQFKEWAETPPKTPREAITVRDAKKFWHAFEALDVPLSRWNMDYYRERMEHLYEVMRGRDSEGVSFDEKALTPRQAAQVINLFSTYIDAWDLRLDVPNGHDDLASSYDGGYTWCEKCGAVAEDDVECCKKRKCPIRAEREG